MNEKHTGFEALVFKARHWELTEWLYEHWSEDEKEFTNAIENSGFPAPTKDKILSLCTGEYSTILSLLIESKQDEHAKVLIDFTIKTLRESLVDKSGFECGPPKTRSNWWENEFALRPKFQVDRGTELTAGVSIDFISKHDEAAEVFLTSWLWLKSGKAGVKHARTFKSLDHQLRTHPSLDKSIEASWPHTICIGISPILAHSDSEFRFDRDAVVAECLAPIRSFTEEHFMHLYEAACISR